MAPRPFQLTVSTANGTAGKHWSSIHLHKLFFVEHKDFLFLCTLTTNLTILATFTYVVSLLNSLQIYTHFCSIYTHYYSSHYLHTVAPMDYTAVVGLVLDFQAGAGRVCHTVAINQDEMCEEPAEDFLSDLAYESGTLPITVIRTPATIIINDSAELECSKYNSLSPSLFLYTSFLSVQMRSQLATSSQSTPRPRETEW